MLLQSSDEFIIKTSFRLHAYFTKVYSTNKTMSTIFYQSMSTLQTCESFNAKGGGVLQKCLLLVITNNPQIKEGGGGAEICFATVRGFKNNKITKREVHS